MLRMQFFQICKQIPLTTFKRLQFNSKYSFQNKVQYLEQNDGSLREYFFFIDHKGLLYLDDQDSYNFTNCLKDKRFMKNFYKNLIKNKTGRNLNYSHVSECWGEYNYVRSSVKPIVFSHLDENDQLHYSLYLTENFNPSEVKKDEQGLLYHKVDLNDIGYGIFSTDVSMMLSKNIKIDGNIMQLEWKGKVYEIQNIDEEEAAKFDHYKD
ncbi:UPF0598 C8orf82-like protein, putative (macronuclear) [Tetrahymena thermophila SB210]|uniref:UPF0598 C8orf82-like protein, putative n=1 Tax=Tetrahymena thermophila (strain SB210) TaxID=312017 RepID=Q23FS8_TETTS|nr:UPF0598 C8orf82-like protein, putative [Tetrahymena thermophila SB210]EAR95532.2 UPF0598 C8orf82-like protein, putative [Tetrahymena thermophila SB210]|eukprot:XP_001015777.2 UPF0598 C8orf82-like protein, putative [Tetrahymena thermophila SB210]